MPVSCSPIDLPSGRLDVLYASGERELVVLIHGNSASKDTFAAQISMLTRRGFGVLALDLPGHGMSDNASDPAATYSFTGYAHVVGQVLDAFGVETAHVAGWSLGGHIGLELMGRDARVQSLLIWGTPPVKPGLDALSEAFLTSEGMAYAGAAVLSADDCALYGAAMMGGPPPQALVDAIQRTDGNARVHMMGNSVKGVGLDARKLVQCDPRPIAVLHGAEDPFVDLAYLRTIAYRNLWGGQVQVLPGAGHAAHWQTPKTFNTLLLSFLLSSSKKLSR